MTELNNQHPNLPAGKAHEPQSPYTHGLSETQKGFFNENDNPIAYLVRSLSVMHHHADIKGFELLDRTCHAECLKIARILRMRLRNMVTEEVPKLKWE